MKEPFTRFGTTHGTTFQFQKSKSTPTVRDWFFTHQRVQAVVLLMCTKLRQALVVAVCWITRFAWALTMTLTTRLLEVALTATQPTVNSISSGMAKNTRASAVVELLRLFTYAPSTTGRGSRKQKFSRSTLLYCGREMFLRAYLSPSSGSVLPALGRFTTVLSPTTGWLTRSKTIQFLASHAHGSPDVALILPCLHLATQVAKKRLFRLP